MQIKEKYRKTYRNIGKLQASQSHLCTSQAHGADHPRNNTKAPGKSGAHW